MKKIIILVAGICFLSLLLVKGAVYSAEEDVVEEIIMYVGQAKTLQTNIPKRIIIGKPEVADVSAATESEITVIAKAQGVTTFVFWDSFGEQDFKIRVFSEDMRETKLRLDSLIKELNFPKVQTRAMDSEGKVLILGEVKTAQQRERIFTALGPLKDKVVDLLRIKEEEAMVDIDVQVLELNKDATNVLGLTNPLSSTGGFSITEGVGAPGIVAPGAKFSNLFKIINLKRDTYNWKLYALVQEGKARILSRPRLACQSGKEAELLVGGEKPIMTTQSVSGGGSSTSVEYKEYGIKLAIKPIVTEDKRIKLALKVEVSDVGTPDTLGSSSNVTAKAYPLTKRNFSTELYLNDGQTMSIGGLRKQKSEVDITKTPGLGDIPIIGLLFRKKETKAGGGTGERGDTELFVTLTPTIVGLKEEPAPEAKPQVKIQVIVETPVVKEAGPPDPLQDYVNIIKRRITDNLTYPSSAKEAGFQGVTKLNLQLSYRGELLDATVKESSGYKILDDNALATAKGVTSYPPFPQSMDEKKLWIEIPIAYTMD